MIRYLSLITFTDQGARRVADSVSRAASFGKAVEQAGGRLHSQYWAVGHIDGCVVFEAPDEETGAALLIKLAKDGNVRTQTMRIYDNVEFEKIVGKS